MNLFASVAELLFPTRCVACGVLQPEPLCPACTLALPYIVDSARPSSALAVDRETRRDDFLSFGGAGARCGKHGVHLPVRSLLAFDGSGRDVIHALKYRNGRGLARVLAAAALERVDRGFFDVDLLTYVPLHPAKRSERGYNQSLLVARALGGLTNVPLAHLLWQARPTADQAKLSADERRENVRGAYDIRRAAVSCRGRTVMLVDDVLTTGATTCECAKVLSEAGATEIRLFTLARAPFD